MFNCFLKFSFDKVMLPYTMRKVYRSISILVFVLFLIQNQGFAQSYKEAKKKAKTAIATKSYKKAIPFLMIMLNKNPNDKKSHHNLAKAVVSARYNKEDLEEFYANLKVTNLKVILPVAHKYQTSLKHKYAFLTYELVQNIDESEETSLKYLPQYTMHNHMWEKAYKYNFRRAKYIKDHKRAFHYNEAGRAAMHWRHYKEAEKAFKLAVNDVPKTHSTKEFMRFLEYKEHRKDATKALRDSIARGPIESSPLSISIPNAGGNINSEADDHFLQSNVDGSMVLFTSRRAGGEGSAKNKEGKLTEDIWISKKDGTGNWTKAENLGKTINTRGHEGPASLSVDEQTLVLAKGLGAKKDLYVSTKIGDEFGKPVKLAFCDKYNNETEPSISPDGKTIYFAAMANAKRDPYNYDLYYTELNAEGNWSKPKKLSSKLNTEQSERAPFIHPDGKTLYFASEGHPGVGGFDIFKSVKKGSNKWSDPVNVGAPINSRVDDIGFTINAIGTKAYFHHARASNTDKGIQEIHVIDLNAGNKTEALTVSPLTVITGIITDESTNTPVNATIELKKTGSEEVISLFKSNPKTGTYSVVVPAQAGYEIIFKKEGYGAHTEVINTSTVGTSSILKTNVKLKKG